jgi:hypothetical protein
MDPEHAHVVGRSRPQDVIAQFIEWWNEFFFRPRGAQAVLCQEISLDYPNSPSFAIYLLDLTSEVADGDTNAGIVERFGSVPEGLDRIDIFDPPDPANNGKPSGKTLISAGPHAARVHWTRGATITQRYDPAGSIQIEESGSQGSWLGEGSVRARFQVVEDDHLP